MDGRRWQRIREILDVVAGVSAADRPRALADACGDDPALRRDVESLLASGDRAESLLGGIVAGTVADLEVEPAVGQRVGPYRIVGELGRGGMGAVYLAERADGQFEQQVALKRVRPGLDTAEFLRRFRDERQILARLQHPDIARLLDGGIDDRGRPYFAMEYVEGEPIDRYCERRTMSIEDRLALFRRVCGAISYAHANLVVHRDLKPAHVLVTADGGIRLLDFGIARVLGEDEPAAAGLTGLGIRAMTPEYASPEQVRGESVSTSTDVYSLGVILYELLTGERPYDLAGRTPAEIERIVCGSEPGRPSTRAGAAATGSTGGRRRIDRREARRVRRRLRGDLDVICVKAMQKDAARRYSSVEALSEDVRRHLEGVPVLARADGMSYRARKFIARHRAGVAVAAAMLIAFGVLATYHAIRLAGERDRARLEAAKAEQVATFLQGLFAVVDPSESKGESVTARELLDQGAARIAEELAGQPAVRASMMRVIGEVYTSLGLFADARRLLESALSAQRALFGDEHEDVAATEMALAVVLQDLGDLDAAEPLFRHSLDVRRRLFGEPHAAVSESLEHLAFFLETKGDPVGALALSRQALDMNRTLFGPDDPRVAEATAELAGFLRRDDRLDEAEPLLREALAVQRRHYGDRDLTVASTMRNLASLLRDRGALDDAETLYREALETRRAILGDEHPDVAIVLNSYAILLDRKGDTRGAIEAYREQIRITEAIHQGQPHPDLAAGYSNLAASLRTLERYDEAAEMFTRSMAIGDAVLPVGHPNRAYPRAGLATVLIEQQKFAQAEPLIREALRLRRAGLQVGHRLIGETLVELGACLAGLGRYAEAETHLFEARRIFAGGPGQDASRAERTERRLDALYAAWGRPRPNGGR